MPFLPDPDILVKNMVCALTRRIPPIFSALPRSSVTADGWLPLATLRIAAGVCILFTRVCRE